MIITTRPAAREAALSPCAGCPWRTANHGKRHPDGWYTKANLRRLWTGLRTGEAPGMSCHPTDPNNPVSEAAQAAGYKEAPDHAEVRECAGSVILQARELMKFQAAGTFTEYRRDNPGAMTREALFAFGMRAAGAAFGGIPVRRDHNLNDPVSVPGAVPWDPTNPPRIPEDAS